jgi:hypothetical protein
MGQILHRGATTTEAIRRAIQHSQDFHLPTSLLTEEIPNHDGHLLKEKRGC